jgi:hypothetical protein
VQGNVGWRSFLFDEVPGLLGRVRWLRWFLG